MHAKHERREKQHSKFSRAEPCANTTSAIECFLKKGLKFEVVVYGRIRRIHAHKKNGYGCSPDGQGGHPGGHPPW